MRSIIFQLPVWLITHETVFTLECAGLFKYLSQSIRCDGKEHVVLLVDFLSILLIFVTLQVPPPDENHFPLLFMHLSMLKCYYDLILDIHYLHFRTQ